MDSVAKEIIQCIAVRALIVHDGKVLLVRESEEYIDGTNKGKYDMPGGKVKPGELFEDALHREVKEECGLAVSIGHPVYVAEWSPIVHGVKMQIIGIFFLCTPQTSDVVLGTDHDDYKWIAPHEVLNYPLLTEVSDAIRVYSSIL